MFIAGLIVGLIVGVGTGFVLAALCNVAGNGIDYEAIEWERMDE